MSWLTDIFQRKPGGTTVGNVIRDVASSLTNGTLGQGAMKLSTIQYHAKTMDEQTFQTVYGVPRSSIEMPSLGTVIGGSFNNVPSLGSTGGSFLDKLLAPFNNQVAKTSEIAGTAATKGALSKYWWVIALPFGLVIFLIIYLIKRTKK